MAHYVSSGTVLSNTITNSPVYVYEGGITYDLTVSGTDIYVDGGSAVRTDLDQGRMTVRSGGKVNSTTVNGKQMYLSSGTEGSNTTVLSGGKLYVSPDAVASNVTIKGGGALYVSSGGSALNVLWTPCEGNYSVAAGGYITFAQKNSGCYFGSNQKLISQAQTMNGQIVTGSMFVMTGGVAFDTVVDYGGSMFISSGGKAELLHVTSWGRLFVNRGGMAYQTTLDDYGTAQINRGGVMIDTQIYSDGRLLIASGGIASDTTVLCGSVTVSSGGIQRGRLQMNPEGVTVKFQSGGIMDFYLANQIAGNDFLINDISIITGTPRYTVTLDSTQAAGVYNLAQGAMDFTKSITLYSETVKLGTLTVNGSALVSGNRNYALKCDGNSLTLDISADTKPDLVVSVFKSASSFNAAQDYQITFTVKNQGSGSAAPGKLYITCDGAKIGEVEVGTITANGSFNGTYTVAAGTLKAGEHKIRLVADGGNVVAETNENNNGYTRTISAVGTADLTIAAFTAPATAASNQDVVLNFTVKNSGDGVAAASKLYIYDDGVKIGEVAVGSIAAGTSYKGSYTIAAGKLAVGANKIRLLADGANTVIETDNNNNGYSKTVNITAATTAQADLLVTGFASAGEVSTAEDLKITVTVKNQGSSSAAASRVYVYNDGVKIGDVYIGSIAAGKTYTNTYTVAAGTLKAGEHKIRLVADGGNVVAETNENNNGYTRSISAVGTADLTIAAFTAPATAASNQDVVLNFTVKNSGDGVAAASKLYIYDDGVKIGDVYIGAVAAGKSYTNTYTVAAGTLKAGAHKIRLVADGGNVVAETNENNNGYTRTISAVGTADLTIAAFTAPATVASNQDVVLNFTVKNSGDGVAAASKLYIYDDGVKIGEVAVGSIAAGTSYKGSYTIAAGKLAAGANKIRLLADGANTVIETDNNNNGYSKNINITAAAAMPESFAGLSDEEELPLLESSWNDIDLKVDDCLTPPAELYAASANIVELAWSPCETAAEILCAGALSTEEENKYAIELGIC